MVSPLHLLGKDMGVVVSVFSRCVLEGVHHSSCPPSRPCKKGSEAYQEEAKPCLGSPVQDQFAQHHQNVAASSCARKESSLYLSKKSSW